MDPPWPEPGEPAAPGRRAPCDKTRGHPGKYVSRPTAGRRRPPVRRPCAALVLSLLVRRHGAVPRNTKIIGMGFGLKQFSTLSITHRV
ncbi:hypothetical protein FRAAL3369 [Frankia alni ACN14a]|uniref:Uncharacterized protein n=1 Tax=Frankia alni (strain DSM 45986 / CECT 9034 / ACN14a) TaxID=326424 RepID=Q0RKE5_FRAAA|nr:hypothetical protein FRAAL3369 [Frankia alni ACN14a]